MIAIKQGKPHHQKIQEKSIKNTRPPQPAAHAAGSSKKSSASASCPADKRENQHSKLHIPTPSQQQQQQQQHNHNHHQPQQAANNNHHPTIQRQTNETRSEIKQAERSLQVAASTPAPSSSSSPSLARHQATGAGAMANVATATSLLTASTKIQQRQQKFLAAAAKSATSPHCYNYPQQPPSQRNAWQTNPAKPAAPSGVGSLQEIRSGAVADALGDHGDTCRPAALDAATCCQHVRPSGVVRPDPAHQSPAVRCSSPAKASTAAASSGSAIPSDRNADHCAHLQSSSDLASQQRAVPSTGVPAAFSLSKSSEVEVNARSQTTSAAAADGTTCDDQSSDSASSALSNHQELRERARVSAGYDERCGTTIDCASNMKINRAATVAPGVASSTLGDSGAAINSGSDTCRTAPQKRNDGSEESGCEYRQHQNQLQQHHDHHHQYLNHLNHHQNHQNHNHHHHNPNQSHHNHQHHQHKQQHPHPQQQHHHYHNHYSQQQHQQHRNYLQPYNHSEVRRPNVEHKEDKTGGEEEDNIINTKKDTVELSSNHHYYNHNNYHSYPHLQYQPAQQITTATPQPQQQQQTNGTHPQQQVMAHYKFHNDCQSSVLTYEQVKRLDLVMDQVVPVHGRGNAPTLFVKLKELIRLVKHKLQHEHSIEIRDVRLNGGAASYVLAPKNSHYNDLDLVFGTDLSNEDRYDVIRDVVLECLMEFYPKEGSEQVQQQKQQAGTVQAYPDQRTECGHGEHPAMGQYNNIGPIDEDVQSESASSRSNRSSSFESDNLNVTTNDTDGASDDNDEEEEEAEEESDDEEDNIIVRIDSEDCARTNSAKGGASTQVSPVSKKVIVNTTAQDQVKGQESGASSGGDAPIVAQSPQQTFLYQHLQMPPNNCAIREAYVHKMVKVNDDDRWSLISLGVQQSETNNYNNMHHNQQQHRFETADDMPFCCLQAQAASPATSCNQQQQQQSNEDWLQNKPPNSIELKFVDRMRRKFEFSVDSFQIILDSLIQFYDYAPQSTITIQKRQLSSHPSSTMIGNHHLMNGRRSSCGQCCAGGGFQLMQEQQSASDEDASNHQEQDCTGKTQALNKFLNDGSSSCGKLAKKKKHTRQQKSCGKTTSLNGSRSYYDLPLEPGNNSLFNSSVASSSGCSSSSSVVSSSSSSLSCDEDHDDLYCEVDNTSSSSSTSSLLSSTTVSVLSSVVNNTTCDMAQPAGSHIKGDQLADLSDGNDGESNKEDSEDQSVGGTSRPTTTTTMVEQQTRKQTTSKNDCTGSKKAERVECDFEIGKLSSCAVISENFYPTVIGRSEYGNFKEALYHLEKKLIATRSPEEIRGGGLLKYCNLLVKNYKPTNVLQIRTLERYMCSRFFIDFSDLNQQRAKLESYLANHFLDDPMQKFHYLTILHNVVQRSTVCLMNHELRLTLNMIRELAYELNEQQQRQHQGQNQLQQAVAQHGPSIHSQPLFSQPPRQQIDQQPPSQPPLPQQYQQQHKPTVVQSGVYRVKLVNYALAKPVKS